MQKIDSYQFEPEIFMVFNNTTFAFASKTRLKPSIFRQKLQALHFFRLTTANDSNRKFWSQIIGVRMLDGQATDILEGSSLSFQSDYIDVYSNCWGPKDDGKTFGKPGKLAQEALMQGALKVRSS